MTFRHHFNHSRFFPPNAYGEVSIQLALLVASYSPTWATPRYVFTFRGVTLSSGAFNCGARCVLHTEPLDTHAGMLSLFSGSTDCFPLYPNDLHAVLYRDQLDPIPFFKRALNRAFRLFVNNHGILHKFSISKNLSLSRFHNGFRNIFIFGFMILDRRT